MIDVGEDSGLRGAGKCIGRHNLIAQGGQSTGLLIAQELPAFLVVCSATDSGGCATHGAHRYKLPPRQAALSVGGLHGQSPFNCKERYNSPHASTCFVNGSQARRNQFVTYAAQN
jgi:hypothetical protein